MRHETLLELAERDGIVLPDALVAEWPPQLSAADEKGWFRFQRLYDVARSVLRTEDDVRRLVLEAAEDDVARRRTVAGDPGRPERVRRPLRRDHGVHRPGARRASATPPQRTGVGDGRGDRRQPHPAPARRPHPGPPGRAVRRPRRGRLRAVQRRAARQHRRLRAGLRASPGGPDLLLAPHGGELLGPDHVRTCLDELRADRLGHGVRSVEDPALLDRIVAAGSPSRSARSPTSRSASTPT